MICSAFFVAKDVSSIKNLPLSLIHTHTKKKKTEKKKKSIEKRERAPTLLSFAIQKDTERVVVAITTQPWCDTHERRRKEEAEEERLLR